jgi:hypothetical protein
MSPCHQAYRRCASVALVLAIVLTALPALLNAQTAPAPKASSMSSDEAVPKAELFIGYQWLNPGGNVPDNSTPPNAFHLPSIAPGIGTNFSYNFTNNMAFEANVGIDWNRYANVEALTGGPKYTWRGEGVNYFVHALAGWERLGARTDGDFYSTGPVIILGGGMDLKLWKALSFRLFEADYQWSHQGFGDKVSLSDDAGLRRPEYKGARLTTGLVFNLGGAPEVPVAAACSIDRNEVMVGEPLHATVAASNFNPKHTLTYAWSSTGGKIEGKDTGASIDTNGAAAGSYTATATVTDPKAKKNNTASCTSNFTVKPLNPPQISCSANPATVEVGTSSTISCTCTSPDNATVTVGGWSSSGGSIAGSGNSATLTTAGASAGTVTVNATCTDSRGLTASTSSSVTVKATPPPPPPPPQASKVNECEYPNLKKPWRVDNTCKAELDDVALKLQQDPDAKLVVVGNAGPKDRRKNLAAERALNVKAYISGGEAKQNIDASRIEARTGNEGTGATQQWIIPAGASFPDAGTTTPVDESKVKAVPDHPKPMAKKKAKKAE